MIQIASFIIALAEGSRALRDLVLLVAAVLRNERRLDAHETIDQRIAAAQAAPWVCPAACPHRVGVDHGLHHGAPGQPGGAPAGQA